MAGKNKVNETTARGRNRIATILWTLHALFMIFAVFVIIRILYIQYVYKPDPELVGLLKPRSTKQVIEPARGAIIAEDGRLLALSTPLFQVYMDCSVMKADFKADKKKGAEKEKEWRSEARRLAEGLSKIYGDKTAAQYYNMIIRGRENNSRYVKIGNKINLDVLNQVKELPLFEHGANEGGIMYERFDSRQYPYGSLARRTIGYVKDNSNSNGNNHIGLEGKFDYVLHGQEGIEWLRVTDNRNRIQNYDSTYVKAEDGMDLRTTLNINIQDIADQALRNQIQNEKEIEGGCVIILDVQTGAIRAMVNLLRDTTDNVLSESYNNAIGRKGEPGSVFKATTLMTVIEDGYVKSLDEKLPTNHGIIKGYPQDDHIPDYERNHGASSISVLDGFKISSNYVFRYLAVTNYDKRPQKFLDKLYMYKLGEAYDFDLAGLQTPSLPTPKSSSWSGTDLGSIAIGYSVAETPLHIVTFYNAIANKGKMMKPYLVETIEENGIVKEKRGPSVLNSSICSRATADTLLRALKAVTEEGTAQRLKYAKCEVAGKTGTSRIILDPKYTGGIEGRYQDKYGRKQNQATFVGFFPADNPKYSAIVTIYSMPSIKSFYGGTLPALTLKEIVDDLYAMDPTWGEVITKKGEVPQMRMPKESIGEGVPDVMGLGLKDAVHEIENRGYRCSYSGSGHVAAQSPEKGISAKKGSVITIRLK
ncbi:MAG: penicillin-binding protein [Bacteroidales bacterium]